MPYYEKSEDWLQQSALLLQARPSTVHPFHPHFSRPSLARAAAHQGREDRRCRRHHHHHILLHDNTSSSSSSSNEPPRGHLVLKTYDPVSGTALKYKTAKAAEVGRLVQMLGTLGRRMAALPEVVVVPVAEDAGEGGSGVQTPVPVEGPPGGGQAGGKGKKKKGKR
ncbi:signal recognition particle 9 kDa protein-domain-containing protein [Lasiosphaeris hirsuta]|uniref:Signal recognition particle 9 kDa protein-domain-containing protein n=1 Tax=Lasiosphaeris hirsuta TaxID=260670 RepID=A0AA40DS96_9PEZI|nr:signal recognition particle 9 kDa protein-domain-containing protein [Lasiosphaeris hirsuta]